ncbi:histidinol dehydrogenase [Candidatus Amarolinea dominans]|uniref:histidinol dehydrogenase n=1 Tax=Candidatus Amarolinea dominans TaxID=3140696 RepID=UPI0031CCAA58
MAGPSHIMPTEGSARFASPLSVADFVKRISLIRLSLPAGQRLKRSHRHTGRGGRAEGAPQPATGSA